jgi:hypothetical protein
MPRTEIRTALLKTDQALRVARLLRGDWKVTDLDRLFSDLRFVEPGFETVREVGHLAAHRGERDRGIVLARAHDMQTSAGHWSRQQAGIQPTLENIEEAGRANLRIMPEARLRELFGASRMIVSQRFGIALKRYRDGKKLSRRDTRLMNTLGFSMTWQYAFDDAELASNFADALIGIGVLAVKDRPALLACAEFIALYALVLMHGAQLRLADGSAASLALRIREETGTLRIKAEIPVNNVIPIMTSVAIFETSLAASRHCDSALLEPYPYPIEIDEQLRLVPLT